MEEKASETVKKLIGGDPLLTSHHARVAQGFPSTQGSAAAPSGVLGTTAVGFDFAFQDSK